jgi:carbon monoxide dehydrogenase subunit G
MKISGADTLPFPVATVWDALLDPRVLVTTIPGCERLETTGDNAYAMTVTAGVAAIKGTYAGSCTLSDLAPHQSLVMKLQGAGAPGTIDATVDVSFEEVEQGTTRISYEADAVVGGMVGGVGQRMLTSVSKRMAKEFFGNVGTAIAGGGVPVAAGAGAAGAAGAQANGQAGGGEQLVGAPQAGVFTAPPKPTGIGSQDDFVKGVAVGAGLVLVGVLAGSLLGRRR